MHAKTKIVKLEHTDIDSFSDLIKIFEGVFEWKNVLIPNRFHLQKVLANPRFFIFVAKSNGKVLGGLTAHVLDRYDTEKPSVYIYDLAVLPDVQRRGIGTALIEHLIGYCKDHGFDEAFVQAETEDVHALNFYRTTPITGEMNAIHFTYSFGSNIIINDGG